MSKRFILPLFALILLLFTSCDMFITTPNPLVGFYKVSDTYGSTAAYYYYYLAEDGLFSVYQAGGKGSSEEVVFEGLWEYSLNHFDFFTASGDVVLHVTSFHGNPDTSGLSLSHEEGKNANPFSFIWNLDKDTGITVLMFSTDDPDICNLPGIAFSISEDEFERATGLVYNPDPEVPDEPDTDEPTPDEPGTDEPGTDEPDIDEPGTDEPDTDEPDTDEPDTENPDTENPDIENPDTENPDTENPDTENPDTENPDTENPDTENPDTENPDTENPPQEEPEQPATDDEEGGNV